MQKGLVIDIIRCDNAGENKVLQARCDSATCKLGIDFEFTSRDTPQQNALAEIAITNANNGGRALMHHAHIPKKFKHKLNITRQK